VLEAGEGRVGSVVDRVLLQLCYSYDPSVGRYTMAAIKLLRGAAIVTVLAIAGGIALMLRRERQARRA
jgi:protein SCO1/2